MYKLIVREKATNEISFTNQSENLKELKRWMFNDQIRLGEENYTYEIVEEKQYNVITEAVDGLRKFQTYRLEGNDNEREIFMNAMIKAGIQPQQLNELINELKKEISK